MTFLLKIVFFIGDLVFLNLAILLSFYFTDPNLTADGNLSKIYLILFSNLGWLFLVLVSNPYSINKGWSLSKILRSQLSFVFIHLLIVASLTIFLKKSYTSFQLVSVYLIFVPIFFGWKILVTYFRKLLIKDVELKKYLLIGRNKLSEEIRKHYLINHEEGYRFQGYFTLDINSPDTLMEDLKGFCETNEVHEIFCCATEVKKDDLQKLINFGLNSLIKVKLIFDGVVSKSIQLGRYDQTPGVDVVTIALDEKRNQFIKRIFDIAFSTLFLITVFSWLLPILFILIKLDSRGPVFYIQPRNGLGNKPFGCFKFRTMRHDRNAAFKQAIENDPRITKLGTFLRSSSIDELPQFINVFLGDMSLIGPRPHPEALNEEFGKIIQILMSRHYVKPGITGLAQCMGYRGETKDVHDMENRIRLDRHYIENWTFWLDIKIIFLTVISLIRGSDKAY